MAKLETGEVTECGFCIGLNSISAFSYVCALHISRIVYIIQVEVHLRL